MKKLNCKLIVSDFDGTLAKSDNSIDEEVVKAIERYIEDGGIFAVCSGRTLPSILPRVRALGLKGLCVACQGSVIADIETGELLRDEGLDYLQTAEICASLEKYDCGVMVYTRGGYYSSLEEGHEGLALYEKVVGVKAKHAPVALSEYVFQNRLDSYKVASLCRPTDRDMIYSDMLKEFGGTFDVTYSANVLVEICPLGEDKGKALTFLADYYNVPVELTCAIGDNLNDLPMLRAAGYGVAVGNAAEELKRNVDYVTVTNDEGAVKRVIGQFGYAK